MSFYLRATGINRFCGGGTYKWLKIRDITKMNGVIEFEVRINNCKRYIRLGPHIEFAKGKWPNLCPCSFNNVTC